jgi:hypothetical protein
LSVLSLFDSALFTIFDRNGMYGETLG